MKLSRGLERLIKEQRLIRPQWGHMEQEEYRGQGGQRGQEEYKEQRLTHDPEQQPEQPELINDRSPREIFVVNENKASRVSVSYRRRGKSE